MSARFARLRIATGGILLIASASCVRTAATRPLPGAVAPAASLPRIALPSQRQLIAFKWDYEDLDLIGRGDGAMRVAPPDSARLDLFMAGGLGSGAAALVGDTLRVPGMDIIRRYLPPVSLLWAALGRLEIPPLPDTVVRVEAGVVRGDIGKPVEWRVTANNGFLLRLDHVSSGRIIEWVTRDTTGHVEYHAPNSRRRLIITIIHAQTAEPFDSSIWSF